MLRDEQEELAALVNHAAGTTQNLLATWLRAHQEPLEVLAGLVGDPARTPPEVMQELVTSVRKLSPDFQAVGVIDARGVTVAYSPPVDEAGSPTVGVDLGKTPYAKILRGGKAPSAPVLLPAYVGRLQPSQLLLSPIPGDGEYRGQCSAVVDPASLQDVLRAQRGDAGVELTVLDAGDRVVVSTRSDLAMLAPFPRREGGTVMERERGVRQWTPELVPGHTLVQVWWDSFFLKEVPASAAVPWKIVAEASMGPIVTEMNEAVLERLFLMAVIGVASVLLAHFASRALVRPIRAFEQTTAALPQRIINGETALTWPRSRVAEIEGLAATFKVMAEALQDAFAELRAQEIREREESFRILFDQAADNILLLEIAPGAIPVIRDANAAALAMLGYERAEMVGQPVTLIDPDPQLDTKVGERRRLLFEEGAVHFEVQHRCKDGSVRALACAASRVRIRGEELVLSTERDVTDLRLAEREQERLRDQLREAQKREAIGTLAGGIAHDFNNILTPILAHAEFALMHLAEGDPAREDLVQIHVSAQRAAELVRQILTVSRQRARGVLVPVDLSPLIKETLKFLRATI
ncbi:MAG: PAS domain S-box protein, partial [Proteobacteria bacterium]|nr:PAS domain S-box protein [Pseudomonadota bacterium]